MLRPRSSAAALELSGEHAADAAVVKRRGEDSGLARALGKLGGRGEQLAGRRRDPDGRPRAARRKAGPRRGPGRDSGGVPIGGQPSPALRSGCGRTTPREQPRSSAARLRDRDRRPRRPRARRLSSSSQSILTSASDPPSALAVVNRFGPLDIEGEMARSQRILLARLDAVARARTPARCRASGNGCLRRGCGWWRRATSRREHRARRARPRRRPLPRRARSSRGTVTGA